MNHHVQFRREFHNFPYVAAGVDAVSVILDPNDKSVWLFEPHLIQFDGDDAGKKQKLSEGELRFQSVDIGSINSIVAVGTNTKVYKWGDVKWVPLEGSGFSYASVGCDGTVWYSILIVASISQSRVDLVINLRSLPWITVDKHCRIILS